MRPARPPMTPEELQGVKTGDRLLACPIDNPLADYLGTVVAIEYGAREAHSRHHAVRSVPTGVEAITLDTLAYLTATTDFWRATPAISLCEGCGAPPFAPCEPGCTFETTPAGGAQPAPDTRKEHTMASPQQHRGMTDIGTTAGPAVGLDDEARAAIVRGITEPVQLDSFGDEQGDIHHLNTMSGETIEQWAHKLTVSEARQVLSRLAAIRTEHMLRAEQTIPLERTVRDALAAAAEWGMPQADAPAARASGAR